MPDYLRTTATLTLLLLGTSVWAETYYVAPPGTQIAGTPDGSAEHPFASVETALKNPLIQGGDTLLLKEGAYGALTLYNYARTDAGQVTIRSELGNSARFDNIYLVGTTNNLTFSNLTLQPDQPDTFNGYLVRTLEGTSSLVFENLQMQSGPDTGSFMDWDIEHWKQRRASGVSIGGHDTIVRDNILTGVYMGITAIGDDVQVLGNLIDGYDGDGLRGIGDNNVFRGNRVFNAIKTDDNHDDGFQSFASKGKPVTGLVLDSNVIVDWTGDPEHPLRSWTLQGIGLFDGFYDNLTITNNLVVNQFNHGITVMGARGAQILNNTVVKSPISSVPNTPSIRVYATKGDDPSTDVIVANNIATGYDVKVDAENRVAETENTVIGKDYLAPQDLVALHAGAVPSPPPQTTPTTAPEPNALPSQPGPGSDPAEPDLEIVAPVPEVVAPQRALLKLRKKPHAKGETQLPPPAVKSPIHRFKKQTVIRPGRPIESAPQPEETEGVKSKDGIAKTLDKASPLRERVMKNQRSDRH